MSRIRITAHMMIKNEARFVWYSIMSVLNYVDRIRIWDTGSNDGTIEVVESIIKEYKGKTQIIFKKVQEKDFDEGTTRQAMLLKCCDSDMKEVDIGTFSVIRQEMLNETVFDWIIMIDGDEIWWKDSIKKLTDTIRNMGDKYESIVVPTVNLVGDIFHYQEGKAGKYQFFGKTGHYNLRAFSRQIPGLHSSTKPHGVWGWEDQNCVMIQDRDPKNILFLDTPYMHATHLQRSGNIVLEKGVYKRAKKLKHEIGLSFPKDYLYPESFFYSRPDSVISPWVKMGFLFKMRSYIETPFRMLKRRIFKSKVGY